MTKKTLLFMYLNCKGNVHEMLYVQMYIQCNPF